LFSKKRQDEKLLSLREHGNILATENQQAIINDVIDIKMGVHLHKT
jgi:hypothetical protein